MVPRGSIDPRPYAERGVWTRFFVATKMRSSVRTALERIAAATAEPDDDATRMGRVLGDLPGGPTHHVWIIRPVPSNGTPHVYHQGPNRTLAR